MSDAASKHETEVIWEKDPSELRYLREFPVLTRKRQANPARKCSRDEAMMTVSYLCP